MPCEAVGGFLFGAVLLLGNVLCAKGAEAQPAAYLLYGDAQCVDAVGSPDTQVGRVTPFLIAITSDRMLVGYAFDNDQGALAERYRYIGAGTSHPAGIRFESDKRRDLAHPGSRKIVEMSRQEKIENLFRSTRLDSAEVAAFSDFPFALFFSSSYLGIDDADISALLQAPGRIASSEHECGKLTVSKMGRALARIEFLQTSADSLTRRRPERRLIDVTQPKKYASGLRRVLYRCEFSPHVDFTEFSPVAARCTVEREAVDGYLERCEYDIQYLAHTTSEARINSEIDKLLSFIPDGQTVSTNDRVDYIWQDQKMVKRIDAVALDQAGRLRFLGARPWRSVLLIGNLLFILVVAYFLFLRRRTKDAG